MIFNIIMIFIKRVAWVSFLPRPWNNFAHEFLWCNQILTFIIFPLIIALDICDVQFPVSTVRLFMAYEHKYIKVSTCFGYIYNCKINGNVKTYITNLICKYEIKIVKSELFVLALPIKSRKGYKKGKYTIC